MITAHRVVADGGGSVRMPRNTFGRGDTLASKVSGILPERDQQGPMRTEKLPSSMNPFASKLMKSIRSMQRTHALAGAIRSLRRIASSAGPLPDEILSQLIYGWGNEAWSAGLELARATSRYCRGLTGDALECGSGATTLLLGVLSEAAGFRAWSLENDLPWHAHVQSQLAKYRLDSAQVMHVPLRSYPDFDWYGVDELLLPASFQFVLCDGPPGQTRGGRAGLLPILGNRLSKGAIVLVDDTVREAEARMVDNWLATGSPAMSVIERAATYVALRVD